VILVGLPGAGKSTIGSAVAERLGRPFLDLDVELERREGRSVGQIFAEEGEGYFRRKERELTEELRLVGNMILAPGGGWIGDAGVVSLLCPPGRLIYLRVRPATALARLGPNRSLRPLLSRPEPLVELERLYRERKAAYEAADETVDTELHGLQRVIEQVAELASSYR
jgi:shikimate kinase